jgi:hypothetical protein
VSFDRQSPSSLRRLRHGLAFAHVIILAIANLRREFLIHGRYGAPLTGGVISNLRSSCAERDPLIDFRRETLIKIQESEAMEAPVIDTHPLAATVFRDRAREGRKGRGWGGKRRCLPGSFVVNHGIENNQEFAHAGD